MATIMKHVNELKDHVVKIRDNGNSIVMVNGCFDLFHAGHLDLLRVAKTHGDILIACVNSDTSIRRNKGDLRPVIGESDRISIVAAICYVDFAILFDEQTQAEIIFKITPDKIVKEAEYMKKEIAERSAIDQSGCEIVFYERSSDISTSAIIERMNMRVYQKS